MVGYWQFHEVQSDSSWAPAGPRRVGQGRFRPLYCMLIWVPQKSRCQERIKHEGILLGVNACRKGNRRVLGEPSEFGARQIPRKGERERRLGASLDCCMF